MGASAVFQAVDAPYLILDRQLVIRAVNHAYAKATLRSPEELQDRYRACERDAEMLRIALQHSRDIGTAIGILMSQHKITADAAFDLLRAVSQRTNRKVRDLAVEVVDTGALL